MRSLLLLSLLFAGCVAAPKSVDLYPAPKSVDLYPADPPEVLEQTEPSEKQLTLVLATTDHCAGCRRAYPIFEIADGIYWLDAVKLHSDTDRKYLKELGVQAYPTWILFEGEDEAWRTHNNTAVLKWLREEARRRD